MTTLHAGISPLRYWGEGDLTKSCLEEEEEAFVFKWRKIRKEGILNLFS